MAFKLPRLKSNLAIVNAKGHPMDYFLRFWNMDVAPQLESQITDLTDITAELQRQLGLILDAQAAADAAQLAASAAQSTANTALATASSGARYAEFGATGFSDTVSVSSVEVGVALQLSGGLDGGEIDADTDWVGEAVLTEEQGGTTNEIARVPISVPSTGLSVPGGFVAGSAGVNMTGFGTLSGSVLYRLEFVRVSGSNYTQFPTLSGMMTLTPKAT